MHIYIWTYLQEESIQGLSEATQELLERFGRGIVQAVGAWRLAIVSGLCSTAAIILYESRIPSHLAVPGLCMSSFIFLGDIYT